MSRPASSARRWPDLLIGLLVALLLLGFALLLFRPEGRPAAPTGAAPATDSSSPAATIPAAPGTDSAAPDAAPSAGTPDTAASGAPAIDTPTTEPAPTDAAEPPTIAAAPEITQAPQNSSPGVSADSGAQAGADSTTGDTPAQPTTPTATAEDSAVPAADPRTGGAVATSERRTPLRSDYRITLGTFNTEQAARSGTAGVSTLGYTVYPIDLGSTVVAQVGPFADESSARQALADIQRAYPRALLYPPRNRSLNSEPASPATSSPAPSSAADTAPAREEAAAPAPAPSGPTYLQVGAFDRVESAQRLVGQLRDLGYSPTVNAPEGRKVSVLVGPFTGDALTRTEQRLSGNGLDHFRVR